ncbi:MAG: DUF2510 domain-containing protein [Acidimicrobiia bacterium]|nr:DUF2510 domain-containing protein [Acidimicrobiia bacterium]
MTTPAGWYPDPYDASQLRYWDGSVWTESVTPAGGSAGDETQQVQGQPAAPDAYGGQDPYGDQGAYGAQGAYEAQGGHGAPGAYGGQPGYEAQGAYGAPGGYGTPVEAGVPYAYGGPADQFVAGRGLGDVGDWLSTTFNRLFERIAPMAILLYGVPVVGFIVFALIGRWLIAGIRITNADAPGGGDISGLAGSRFLALFVVGIAALLVAGVCWLAANHQMYAAHAGQAQPLGASVTTGLRRLPRTIGWGLVMLALILVVYVVMVLALIAILAASFGIDGDGNPFVALLLLPLGLVFLVIAVWLWVKLAFWGIALAVGPGGTNPFSASWSLSRDRFWSVFGRLLLLFVIVWLIGTVFNFGAQIVFGTAMSTLFQVDPITGDILVNGQPVEDQSIIDFGELAPGPLWFALLAIVYAFSQAVTQAIAISATAGLYLRGGGPGEI